VRRVGIEDSIVGNHQNHKIGHIGIGYLIVGMIVLGGSEYLIVRMIVLGGLEYSIVGMIGVGRLELNI
jgi:hypothetical protein